jgi:hypothetical protein
MPMQISETIDEIQRDKDELQIIEKPKTLIEEGKTIS